MINSGKAAQIWFGLHSAEIYHQTESVQKIESKRLPFINIYDSPCGKTDSYLTVLPERQTYFFLQSAHVERVTDNFGVNRINNKQSIEDI